MEKVKERTIKQRKSDNRNFSLCLIACAIAHLRYVLNRTVDYDLALKINIAMRVLKLLYGHIKEKGYESWKA